MEWFRYLYEPLIFLSLGYIALRLMGKRSVGEIALFDLLMVLILSNILSAPLQQHSGITAIVLMSMTVVFVHRLLSFLKLDQRWRRLVRSQPHVLIRHGNIDEKELKKASISIRELMAELRVKGYTKASDVEFAILEEMGRMSVLPKSQKRPVNPSDLGIVTPYEGLPVPIIIDGQIEWENMAKIRLSPEHLYQLLSMQGVTRDKVKFISYAVLDENKQLLLDWNDDLNQGQVEAEEQGLVAHLQQNATAASPSPEEQNWGLVDDYIKP